MNGHFSPLPMPAAAPARTELRRLAAALAASVALHAVLVFLPYLGQRNSPGRPPLHALAAPPHVFSATLTVLRPGVAAVRMTPHPDDTGTQAAAAPTASDPPKPAPRGSLELLPIAAPAYYTTDQLTKRPQPVVLAELDTAETMPIVASGKLILKLWIDDQGAVADAVVEKSDLPEILSRQAIAAFKSSRFVPGERNGLRVGSVMRIEVSYDDGRMPDR